MRINSTLYYVLTDHLGSASVVTNASGSIVGEQGYYPFGETRFTTGTMYTDKLYTGQREITGLGIYHYNARFYSPKLGRFLSADTIVPGFANPQNLNRYSYVGNSPLNYTDPSGHMQVQDGPQDDDFSQSDFDDYVPLPDPGSNENGNEDGDNEGPDDSLSSGNEVATLPTVTLPPYYPNFDYFLSNYPSSVNLHPSDYLLGAPTIGVIPLYSSDGTVTGYFEIVNNPGTISFDPGADGVISGLQSIGINVVVQGLASLGYCGPHCQAIVFAITALDVANQSIVITANPQVGVMVPVHPVPYPELPDMPNPLPSHP